MRNQQEFFDEVRRRQQEALSRRRVNRGRILISCVSIVLCLVLLVTLLLRPAMVQAADLMQGITPARIPADEPNAAFTRSQLNFGLKLFQAGFAEGNGGNTLISPLSTALALAMTANGAGGQTKSEMEAVLGMEIGELNRNFYNYVNQLPSSKNARLALANSIWFRDSEQLQVNRDFLQTNADYYGAGAFAAPFDNQTVKDINNWTKQHTDGMIDKLLDDISSLSMLYLINALTFDAKWENPYKEDIQLYNGTFTAENGEKQTARMMSGAERWYLQDSLATGFAKDYAGGDYRFVALLPNEGVTLEEYVTSLTPESLENTLATMKSANVYGAMPQFSYDHELRMNDVLAGMGMPTAFVEGGADFKPMAECTLGDLYIGEVLHKTHITVDTEGTRAAAVTKVELMAEGAIGWQYSVVLNRPFVYLIVDTHTNLPVFIGALTSLG